MHLTEIRTHLEARKRELDAEIHGYPTPIPRCDAQFNHLFVERSRVVKLIERLDELEKETA